jgi:hypothetical protein
MKDAANFLVYRFVLSGVSGQTVVHEWSRVAPILSQEEAYTPQRKR